MYINRKSLGLFLISLVLSFGSNSALLDLQDSPLFLDSSEKANLMLVMDDSGSMDFEISIADTTDGVLWWSEDDSSFVGADQAGQINRHESGWEWEDGPHFYLFPNGTIEDNGADRRWYPDDTDATLSRAVPPFIQFAFVRTPEINTSYYNNNVTYEPWFSSQYGGTSYSDMDPLNALFDPDTDDTNTASINLTQNMESNAANFVFGVYDGMTIPAGTRYHNGTDWVTSGSDTVQDDDEMMAISYFPATYFRIVNTGSYSQGGSHNCASPDPAQFVTFSSTPSGFSSAEVDALTPDGRCLKQVEIKPSTTSYPNNGNRTDCVSPGTCSYAEEIQNFANWFSYHRKRYLALRFAMGKTFENLAGVNAGLFTINDVSDGTQGDLTMLDLDTPTDNLTLFDLIYGIDAGGGTPNRLGLDFAGQQLMRMDTDAPIKNSCQKNFALQFTDGYSEISTDSGAGNADGSAGAPFADSFSDTLADIAYKYYSTPLRTGAGFTAGQIDVPSACSESSPPAGLDCNTDLHMNTYGIVLGGIGKDVYGVNDGGTIRHTVADAHSHPPTWPDVNTNRNATQIDDLYHATVNGRGEMFRATTPQELTASLKQALESIKNQAGSLSRVSFNSSALSSGSLLYSAAFDSDRWSGDIKAFALDVNNGDLNATPAWSASQNWLDKTSGGLLPDSRVILTHNGAKGIGFKWGNWSKFSTAQQADLNATLNGTAQEALEFIRGDRTKEGAGGFRTRASALGDIINSNLVYVGNPPLKWPDSSLFTAGSGPSLYSDYRLSLINNPRKEMVYVGANDGMLHGFVASSGDIDSGKEILAFIPHSLFSSNTTQGLHYLTSNNYKHKFYVDLSPTVSDVILNNQWSTILIGAERSGGRSLFALDVTNPALFGDDDTSADNTVLWEFTDADLGYTFSKPTIVKLNNGKWGAVFGNGYNDTGSGQATLFIVELEPGGSWNLNSNYYKLTTGVGSTTTPNGLATPAVVDLDGNGTADRAYAGDLRGNLWAFDISDASTTNWKSVYENPVSVPVPLFRARHGAAPGVEQPITMQPAAVLHPTITTDPLVNAPNVMLFFGTGQYLETSDLNNASTQTFYGVWDRGTGELGRPNLQVQTLLDDTNTDASGNVLRLLSDNAVNYAPALPEDLQYGWYFDLPVSGERSIITPYVRGDLVFYNTWVPSTPPCTSGGTGFLMSVSQETGGAPAESAFNITADLVVDGNDKIAHSGLNIAPSGKSFNHGLPGGSGFIDDFRFTVGTELEIGTTTVADCPNGICKDILAPLSSLKTGRLSWQELGRD
ncbi:MAG: hypothetical protein K0U68_04225 [Gammaproteobacteria bacterium]|nr:hypothetical protein [Gammaproteobacteria bacterium]